MHFPVGKLLSLRHSGLITGKPDRTPKNEGRVRIGDHPGGTRNSRRSRVWAASIKYVEWPNAEFSPGYVR